MSYATIPSVTHLWIPIRKKGNQILGVAFESKEDATDYINALSSQNEDKFTIERLNFIPSLRDGELRKYKRISRRHSTPTIKPIESISKSQYSPLYAVERSSELSELIEDVSKLIKPGVESKIYRAPSLPLEFPGRTYRAPSSPSLLSPESLSSLSTLLSSISSLSSSLSGKAKHDIVPQSAYDHGYGYDY